MSPPTAEDRRQPVAVPPIVDQPTWEAALAELRTREKAATRELDALAAARRRLPMVELPDYTLEGCQLLRPSISMPRAAASDFRGGGHAEGEEHQQAQGAGQLDVHPPPLDGDE